MAHLKKQIDENGKPFNTVRIFISDFTPEAQEIIKEAAGVYSIEEINWDVIPLTELQFTPDPD